MEGQPRPRRGATAGPQREDVVTTTKTWHAEVFLYEEGDHTRADVLLRTDAGTELRSTGLARRNPGDREVPEIGDELGVTTNNAHQLLFRTKKRLSAGIRAWVLVRGGRPRCDGLASALQAAAGAAAGREASPRAPAASPRSPARARAQHPQGGSPLPTRPPTQPSAAPGRGLRKAGGVSPDNRQRRLANRPRGPRWHRGR